MPPPGPLGMPGNPGVIDTGTSALTHHRPPGPLCITRPTQAQLDAWLDQNLHRLFAAIGPVETRSVLGSLLGEGSFTAGAVAGMAKNLAGSVAGLADLYKTLALAEYHQVRHSPGFWQQIGHAMSFAAMQGWTVAAMSAWRSDLEGEARRAFEDREALFAAVVDAFEHPGDVLRGMTAHQVERYRAFRRLQALHTLEGDFQAGMLFGELLLDVLAVLGGAAAAARLVARVPGLARMLPRLQRMAPEIQASLRKGGMAPAAAETTTEALTPSQVRQQKLPPATQPVPEKPASAGPAARMRKPRQPTKRNPNIDHSRTVQHADGSSTYFDKQGRSVTYSSRGFADFSPHAEAEVRIVGLKGTFPPDDQLANQAVGLKSTPKDYTWHHVEDGETMQLIPTDVHRNFPHTGGASFLRNQH